MSRVTPPLAAEAEATAATVAAAESPAWYPVCLRLNQIELLVHLGVSEAERHQRQPVWVDVALHMPALPPGCHDDHAPYLCYGALTARLQAVAEASSYALLEYLAARLAAALDAWLPEEAQRLALPALRYTLDVLKKPVVPGLRGGASFRYCTLPPGARAAFAAA